MRRVQKYHEGLPNVEREWMRRKLGTVFKTQIIHSDAETRLFQINLLLVIRYSERRGRSILSKDIGNN